MTLSRRVALAVEAQEREIDRLQTQARTDLEAARTRLRLLRKAQAACTAEVDALLMELEAAGIWSLKG